MGPVMLQLRRFQHAIGPVMVGLRGFLYAIRPVILELKGFLYTKGPVMLELKGFLYAISPVMLELREFLYAIRPVMLELRGFPYTIRPVMLELRGFLYAIRPVMLELRGFLYAIRPVMLELRGFPYTIRPVTLELRGFLYAICPVMLELRGFPYTIRPVTLELRGFLYAICPVMLELREFLYAIRPVMLELRGFPYTIRPVTLELRGFLYAICPVMLELRGFPYTIRPVTLELRGFLYAIRPVMLELRGFPYTIRPVMLEIKGFLYTKGPVMLELREFLYAIRPVMLELRGFPYTIRPVTLELRGFLYAICPVMLELRGFLYAIWPVMLELRGFLYAIRPVMLEIKGFLYTKGPVTLELRGFLYAICPVMLELRVSLYAICPVILELREFLYAIRPVILELRGFPYPMGTVMLERRGCLDSMLPVILPPRNLLDWKKSVIQTTKAILRAKASVRGMKTALYLDEALSNIQEALEVLQIGKIKLKIRELKRSHNVCPEEYKGAQYGYPFYYKGFQATNCSYAKPIRALVTVLLLYNTKMGDMSKLLTGFHDAYGNMNILIGMSDVHYNEVKKKIKQSQSNVSIKIVSNPSPGLIWNSLIKDVKTPYVFIGRDLYHFTSDARLERLVRTIEELDVDIAAGASRDPLGQWKQSCYQTALKNYSLVYVEGYDLSINECLFCDHTDSPFIIRSNIAKKMLFNEKISDSGLFTDFFLRCLPQKHELVVCPDSMFYVDTTIANDTKSWKKFAETWNIDYLDFQPNIKLEFPCIGYSCNMIKGYAVSPCCLRELANLLKFVLHYCHANGIICEISDGTLVGAVKFGKILPWDIDGDLTFLSANFTALHGIRYKAKDAGYGVAVQSSVKCCKENRTMGDYMTISSKHWTVDLWGQYRMDSELLIMDNMYPTTILLDGCLARVPRNPGLNARNRYGRDIYAHAPHWRALHHKNSWVNYKTRRFIPCERRGRHECLDAYNGDGSIQFGHPIP